MKYIKNLLLLGTFLALLGLFLIVSNQPSSRRGIVEESGMEKIFHDNTLLENVKKIKITPPGGEVFVILKGQGAWFINKNNALVSTELIDEFLYELFNLYGEIRYKGDSELESFELTDDKYLSIEIEKDGSKDILYIMVGKKSGETGRFIKYKNSQNVYEVSNAFINIMGIKEKSFPEKIDYHPWLENYPLKFYSRDVASLKIINADKTKVLKDDQPEFSEILSMINNIKVDDIIDPLDDLSDRLEQSIIMTRKDGEIINIVFVPIGDKEKIIIKIIEREKIANYIISKGQKDSIFLP